MLSHYAKHIAEKHELTTGKSSKNSKLISSLTDKQRYVIHELNLKQAVDAGLELTKIHRVIEFNSKTVDERFHRLQYKQKKRV